MRTQTLFMVIILQALLLGAPAMHAAIAQGHEVNQTFKVSSPNKKIRTTVTLEGGKPYYQVSSCGEALIAKSPLGLVSEHADYSQGLSVVRSEKTQIEETYTLVSGKRSSCTSKANELTLHLLTAKGQPFDIIMRVADDGVAFRYGIPSQDGQQHIVIKDEASAVCPAQFKYILGQKFKGGRNSPNFPYESFYGLENQTGTITDWATAVNATGDSRFNSPVMIGSGSQHILVSEAENIGTYSLSLIKAYASPTGCVRWQHAGTKEHTELDNGKIITPQSYRDDHKNELTVDLPLLTPWRTLQLGSLKNIFESTMQENLCKPAQGDYSWVEPGIAAWDWGGVDGETGDYGTPTIYEADCRYIDMAAKMGWKYICVDGGWRRDWIHDIMQYANKKGVKVLLWGSAGKYGMHYTRDNYAQMLRDCHEWGVAGVKIDFWEDDSREAMQRMVDVLELAAQYHINVNFHGCTRPSGLRRTYPNLLSYEGIMGGENNFWRERKWMTAQHNINSIFTRNVVGSADFTPVDFALRMGKMHQNYTWAQNLGLCVAYENGITHICESYQNLLPLKAAVILKRVPCTWDDSRLLEGEISEYATIARRKGNDWWVAGLTVAARTAQIDLKQLLDPKKTYTAYIYRDGDTKNKIVAEKLAVTAAAPLSIQELAEGGFLVQISENSNLEMPATEATYEAEDSLNRYDKCKVVDDALPYTSGGKKVSDLGMGRALTFSNILAEKEGDYTVTFYFTTKETRYVHLHVNGEETCILAFRGNAENYSMARGSFLHKVVHLKAGSNTITLRTDPDAWGPDVDRITVAQTQAIEL